MPISRILSTIDINVKSDISMLIETFKYNKLDDKNAKNDIISACLNAYKENEIVNSFTVRNKTIKKTYASQNWSKLGLNIDLFVLSILGFSAIVHATSIRKIIHVEFVLKEKKPELQTDYPKEYALNALNFGQKFQYTTIEAFIEHLINVYNMFYAFAYAPSEIDLENANINQKDFDLYFESELRDPAQDPHLLEITKMIRIGNDKNVKFECKWQKKNIIKTSWQKYKDLILNKQFSKILSKNKFNFKNELYAHCGVEFDLNLS